MGERRRRGRAGAVRGRPDGGRGRGDLPPAARVKVLHLHKLTGVSGSEGHLLALLPGPARARRRRPLPRARRARHRLRRASTRSSTGSASRTARSAAGSTSARGWRATSIRAVRAEQPDLVHTHLVHADVYGGAAARLLGIPSISTRHNDDRYLLGPFRYVDRAFARPARRLIAISDAVRALPRAGGPRPGEAGDDPLRARRAAGSAVRADARRRRDPARCAARPRRRPPDRAEGSRDAAAGVRARPHGSCRRRGSPSSAAARSRPRPGRLVAELGLDDAVVAAGPHRHPRLARARRRLRAHARAGRGSGSSCSRRCWPGCRSSRRG